MRPAAVFRVAAAVVGPRFESGLDEGSTPGAQCAEHGARGGGVRNASDEAAPAGSRRVDVTAVELPVELARSRVVLGIPVAGDRLVVLAHGVGEVEDSLWEIDAATGEVQQVPDLPFDGWVGDAVVASTDRHTLLVATTCSRPPVAGGQASNATATPPRGSPCTIPSRTSGRRCRLRWSRSRASTSCPMRPRRWSQTLGLRRALRHRSAGRWTCWLRHRANRTPRRRPPGA